MSPRWRHPRTDVAPEIMYNCMREKKEHGVTRKYTMCEPEETDARHRHRVEQGVTGASLKPPSQCVNEHQSNGLALLSSSGQANGSRWAVSSSWSSEGLGSTTTGVSASSDGVGMVVSLAAARGFLPRLAGLGSASFP